MTDKFTDEFDKAVKQHVNKVVTKFHESIFSPEVLERAQLIKDLYGNASNYILMVQYNNSLNNEGATRSRYQQQHAQQGRKKQSNE